MARRRRARLLDHHRDPALARPGSECDAAPESASERPAALMGPSNPPMQTKIGNAELPPHYC